ncbi:MAG TPA: hypothetical protein VMW42_08290 [Desulfatiglandales bacterium]|nr:hypothetical protein [Desulfatiglandales bacterium]
MDPKQIAELITENIDERRMRRLKPGDRMKVAASPNGLNIGIPSYKTTLTPKELRSPSMPNVVVSRDIETNYTPIFNSAFCHPDGSYPSKRNPLRVTFQIVPNEGKAYIEELDLVDSFGIAIPREDAIKLANHINYIIWIK